jgi:DNA invertase Pin-like site-specific DNA recombinase
VHKMGGGGGGGVRAKLVTMIAAYLRVSSRAQDLATQRRAIELAAKARKHRVTEWFTEKQSGRSLVRPALSELRAAVRAGRVRVLYVFRIDRLSRSGIRDTVALMDELRGAGCRVVTVADGFDLDGPASDVVLAVLAWAAQMERVALGERISAARARMKAEGRAWGRPRRADAATVRRVLELAGKRTQRAIAVALKIPRSTVGAIIARSGAYAAAEAPSKARSPKRSPRRKSTIRRA